MAITRDRFELALQHLKSSDWSRFESLASAFLVSDYGALRTMASTSGDGGRDAQIFCPDGELDVAFQYSVTTEWKPKIKATIKRIREEFSDVRQLIYVTNQLIGAKADTLRREAKKDGLSLDIYDQSWFLERSNLDPNRSAAAEELARAVVDPILADKGLIAGHAEALTRADARTALLYLELQREDDVAGKNLTRSSFEALVRAALSGSDRDNLVSRSTIYDRVQAFLPQHGMAELKPFIDSALSRLKRGPVTEWNKGEEFHLSHDETERLKNSASKLLVMRQAFELDIANILAVSPGASVSDMTAFMRAVHSIIETYFLRRGEEFAEAVYADKPIHVSDADLKQIVTQKTPKGVIAGRDQIGFMLSVVTTALNTPSVATKNYLRILSDSYTLFSFLSETPDVQKATNKLFSSGEIWVDTSVLLPVLAETSSPSDFRPFTSLFSQLRKAGAKVYVTPGVLEEVRSHLEICLNRARSTQWTGTNPFVFAQYVINGGAVSTFAGWVDKHFMGSYAADRDLEEYFAALGMIIADPSDDSSLPQNVRSSVSEYWQQVHARRRNDPGTFNLAADRLARHDIENCLTVIVERSRRVQRVGLGHKSWWLTLDSAAYKMQDRLDPDVWQAIKYSPVISLDFLMKYLAFGPARDKLQTSDVSVDRVFGPNLFETIPSELIDVALKVREENREMEEHQLQRRIRDALDVERSKIGQIHQNGLDDFSTNITSTF